MGWRRRGAGGSVRRRRNNWYSLLRPQPEFPWLAHAPPHCHTGVTGLWARRCDGVLCGLPGVETRTSDAPCSAAPVTTRSTATGPRYPFCGTGPTPDRTRVLGQRQFTYTAGGESPTVTVHDTITDFGSGGTDTSGLRGHGRISYNPHMSM